MVEKFSRIIGGRELSMEVGRVAGLADGAVVVRYGDSMILVTACMDKPREGIDFFPLTVDYEERLYAAGKIPGSFFRREGRPSSQAIITARLTDRPLRPLFPKGMRNDIQIVGTTLSADQENDPDILMITGASAALTISGIPFDGPIVGYIDGQFIVNPTFAQLDEGQLDLVVAGSRDAVVMVEAAASEVPETVALEAIRIGQEVNGELIALQEEMAERVGKPKMEVEKITLPDEVVQAVREFVQDRGWDLLASARDERDAALAERRKEIIAALGETYPGNELKAALTEVTKSIVRSRILEQGQRPDGRRTEASRRSGGASFTTTTSRPSPSARRVPCGGRPAATSATAPSPSAPSCPSSPTRRRSPTRSAWARRGPPAPAARPR